MSLWESFTHLRKLLTLVSFSFCVYDRFYDEAILVCLSGHGMSKREPENELRW